MAKKHKQALMPEPGADESEMLASAQQIWQASLGAFARAQEENGGHGLAARLAGEPDAIALPPTDDITMTPARPSWDRLEQVFEQRVARALVSLGLPSQAELALLRQQVDTLRAQVAALAKPAPAKGAARTLKKPSAKKKGASRKQAS